MSIEKNININQIKCKYSVIEILKFNSPLFLHLFDKALMYYLIFQLGPKSCKKSTLVYGNQIPIRSSEIRIVGTMFVIDREEHVLHINCPVF